MDVPVTKSEVHFYFDGKGDTCTAQPTKFEWKHIFRDAQAPETLKGLGLSSTAIAALTADEKRARAVQSKVTAF